MFFETENVMEILSKAFKDVEFGLTLESFVLEEYEDVLNKPFISNDDLACLVFDIKNTLTTDYEGNSYFVRRNEFFVEVASSLVHKFLKTPA